MDVLAVADAARRAVDAMRAGGGPHFLEARTYRFRAHSMFDPELYRDKEEVLKWRERDPIDLLRNALDLDDQIWQQMEDEIAAEVEDAVTYAEESPDEDVADLMLFVYSPDSSAAGRI
jgi:pyruvate dehydrogenase E1 component alpha subunit